MRFVANGKVYLTDGGAEIVWDRPADERERRTREIVEDGGVAVAADVRGGVVSKARLKARLKLKAVHKALHESCRKHAKEGDYEGMFTCCDSNGAMAFLVDNQEWFRERGVFEEVMLLAWNTQRFTHGYQPWMRMFLAFADREKLMAASEPLPEGERFTVYRGVTSGKLKLWGKRIGGDKRCLSWTLDPAVARTFANTAGLPGTVYATEVSRHQIYAYLGGKGNRHGYRPESEVLLLLDKRHSIRVHEKIRSKRTVKAKKEAVAA